MSFTGVNYLAVIIATLAGFGLGAVWYTVLVQAVDACHRQDRGGVQATKGPANVLPFVIAIVAAFVMALMLAGLMGHLGDVTVRGGMISGFFVWLGFVITTMGVNHAFSGAKPMLTLIDGFHWLAVLLIQGAVIGAFGV